MKRPFITEILERIVSKIKAKLLIEPEYRFVGQITFKNGKNTFFNNTSFNINSLGSVGITKDKSYASFFLKKFGYKVPEGGTFFSDKLNENIKIRRDIHDGFKYAKKLGFPVVLKPNNKSQGILVVKVNNKTEYYKIAKKILSICPVMIVERYYLAKDYRIVVLDNKIISAYERIPLSIIGDGKNSIQKLLIKKQNHFIRTGRDTKIDISDFRIKMKLKRQKLTLDSILNKDHIVSLLDNANLSGGGTAIDITHIIHSAFKILAINVTRDMGLRLCGVDILTNNINKPISDYVIIEINGAPGLDNYGTIGKEQQDRVDNLYLQILKALSK